ncbi:YvrJ family protein [Sporomusa acidovorans]|uniref:YvrJ protein family protein n=1 Tax=Sporomusa acidovorans (strain ATCC 49682 / DSM 3132 / Mol) TaxID=1123286 RepID=A0ABZ3IYW4_SPOA4|nr:YvrJ family protein [Sporomusa acidovorans]OZC17698.1 YvrJ protein family protein [Sporomusa acidovorans DSM 3132]SDE12340.1 YvrJ protein family protein [Sporomusa acidovorans]
MEELACLTATYGFPLVVAFYLMVRLEKRLTELISAINQMCSCVERMEVTKKGCLRQCMARRPSADTERIEAAEAEAESALVRERVLPVEAVPASS